MKKEFPGYYRPSTAAYKELWQKAVIVLDTNVLLSAYRTPKAGREALLELLEALKDRLWIPHQVAVEFQRNRLNVISEQRKVIDDALGSCEGSLASVLKNLADLDLDARGLDIDPKPLVEALEKAHQDAGSAIKKAREAQLGLTHDDPIRDRLDAILEGRVGPSAGSQAELDAIYQDGEGRYKLLVPPGFEDSEKGKPTNEAVYVSQGLRYQRMFGDLLLWKQIIAYAKDRTLTHVILVTSDKKEDWWLVKEGKTIGPHPELISEIRRESGVELFWMYKLPEFMKQAASQLDAKVSQAGLQEVRETIAKSDMALSLTTYLGSNRAREVSFRNMMESQAEIAVLNWLVGLGAAARPNGNDFPDIVVSDPGLGRIGYEVVVLGAVELDRDLDRIRSKLRRGQSTINTGLYQQFNLVLVVLDDEFQSEEEARALRNFVARRAAKMRTLAPQARIFSGSIRGGKFSPIFVPWLMGLQPGDAADELQQGLPDDDS